MADPSAAFELPLSLQAMIADARQTVERWNDDDDDDGLDSDAIEAAKQWAVRLSRGEYDEVLYWECVAEDCEAAGDWDGAKAAYQRLIELEANGLHGFSSAHSHLAAVHSLLGEQERALAHARLATARQRERDSPGGISLRTALVHEAWLLLRMGRIHAARRAVNRGLGTFEEEFSDDLTYANLNIASAACNIARRDAVAAAASLQEAWSFLEALRTSYEENFGAADSPSGICRAYLAWWRVEAERRQLAGEGETEIEALQHAVEHARRAAEGWRRVGWDAAVMRALDSLSEAYQRHGRSADAEKTRAEADEIRRRWHLPEAQAAQPSKMRSPWLFFVAFIRKWREKVVARSPR